MENYFKGKNVEEEIGRNDIPIKDLPVNFLWMQAKTAGAIWLKFGIEVKGGSKMTNLLSHVSGILEDNGVSAIVWSGAGVAIAKAISCAEIIKRQFSIEHQLTKLTYKKVEEYWEPKIDGLETIVVKRQIPVIHILLSLEPLTDMNQLGYQSLQSKKFWQSGNHSTSSKPQQNYKSKKTFKHKHKSNEVKQ